MRGDSGGRGLANVFEIVRDIYSKATQGIVMILGRFVGLRRSPYEAAAYKLRGIHIG